MSISCIILNRDNVLIVWVANAACWTVGQEVEWSIVHLRLIKIHLINGDCPEPIIPIRLQNGDLKYDLNDFISSVN